jgi:hypothetical protein
MSTTTQHGATQPGDKGEIKNFKGTEGILEATQLAKQIRLFLGTSDSEEFLTTGKEDILAKIQESSLISLRSFTRRKPESKIACPNATGLFAPGLLLEARQTLTLPNAMKRRTSQPYGKFSRRKNTSDAKIATLLERFPSNYSTPKQLYQTLLMSSREFLTWREKQ